LAEVDKRHEEALKHMKSTYEEHVAEMQKELQVAAKAFQIERQRYQENLESKQNDYCQRNS
jgi:hypothetical protein